MIYIYCNDCKHIKICKHYEYFCRYPELSIFDCALKEPNKKQPIQIKEEYKEPEILPLKLIKKDKPKKIYDPPEFKTCTNCEAKTYGELYKCNICGTTICDSCAYYGDSNLDNDGGVLFNEYLCEKCYEETHQEEEIVDEASLFELLTSNFNGKDD